MGTQNRPSLGRLAKFYASYSEARPSWYDMGVADGALQSQYQFYADRIAAQPIREGINWLDVGTGHGEIANLLAKQFPNGSAVDIGPRPPELSSNIAYHSKDINDAGWALDLEQKFALVFSVAVWEHVYSPSDFAKQSLSAVAPGGTLYLICPDYGSAARKALGTRWPYFEPGEHLSIPTQKGARDCLINAARELDRDITRIHVQSLNVRYSFRYLFYVLRLRQFAKMFPPHTSAPLPTGILSATVELA